MDWPILHSQSIQELYWTHQYASVCSDGKNRRHKKALLDRIESMQQSSATQINRKVGIGLPPLHCAIHWGLTIRDILMHSSCMCICAMGIAHIHTYVHMYMCMCTYMWHTSRLKTVLCTVKTSVAGKGPLLKVQILCFAAKNHAQSEVEEVYVIFMACGCPSPVRV